ncbi:MAG: hypothetical protein ACREBC_24605 [Pyrinomonadaceae bacterium]
MKEGRFRVLSRETALQRSTVSLIVDDLKADGIIEEVWGASTGWRPPILLSLWTVDAAAIGVDVGKTRTVIATGDFGGACAGTGRVCHRS